MNIENIFMMISMFIIVFGIVILIKAGKEEEKNKEVNIKTENDKLKSRVVELEEQLKANIYSNDFEKVLSFLYFLIEYYVGFMDSMLEIGKVDNLNNKEYSSMVNEIAKEVYSKLSLNYLNTLCYFFDDDGLHEFIVEIVRDKVIRISSERIKPRR